MKEDKAMFCKKCGKELEDNVRFCNYCGAEVESKVVDFNEAVGNNKPDNSYATATGSGISRTACRRRCIN